MKDQGILHMERKDAIICIMGGEGSTCYPTKCQPDSEALAQTLMEKNKQIPIMRPYLYTTTRFEAIWLAAYIGTISKASVTLPTETD